MYSMDSLEYAIRELYRSGIGENSGLSADEVEELLDGIDFHALLQAVRHHAETVFAFATQGNQPKSFNYRGAELLSTEDDEMIQAEKPHQIFCIHGRNIPIYDPKLSCALSHLMPADREIVLLYFFRELTDEKIAPLVHMSRPTVSRRRKAATRRLRELMEDTS